MRGGKGQALNQVSERLRDDPHHAEPIPQPTPHYMPESLVFTCAAFPQLGHLVDARLLPALQLLQNTALQELHSQ